MDYSPPGSSVHGISQARILEWVIISFSRGSSQSSDQTCVSDISCNDRRVLFHCITWEVNLLLNQTLKRENHSRTLIFFGKHSYLYYVNMYRSSWLLFENELINILKLFSVLTFYTINGSFKPAQQFWRVLRGPENKKSENCQAG